MARRTSASLYVTLPLSSCTLCFEPSLGAANVAEFRSGGLGPGGRVTQAEAEAGTVNHENLVQNLARGGDSPLSVHDAGPGGGHTTIKHSLHD